MSLPRKYNRLTPLDIYVPLFQIPPSNVSYVLRRESKQKFTIQSSHYFNDNGQNLDSFVDHFEQHFHTTTSRTDLRKYTAFKVVKQLSPVDAIKTFTKPNCNLCMEERLTILKKLREKRVTIMNKNSEIYGACRHKTCFHRFFLSTDDSVLNG